MPVDRDRPRKRQRVTQACHRCRSKKYRCNAEGPPCGACRTAQADCSYDNATAARRRGLRPGYVKILESLWGSVLQSIPGSEDVASRILAHLPSSAEHGTTTNAQSPLESWQSSTLPAAINTVLDGGTLQTSEPSTFEVDRQPPLHLPDLTWSLPPPPLTNEQTPDTASFQENPATSPSIRHPFSPTSCPVISDLPDLPDDWQALVQVYICTEYCWLPLFEKSSLYRWAYSYQEQSSISIDLESTCRGHYASLWAALILAELHSNGDRSARMNHMKQAGKRLLSTTESVGPDFTYAAAFLLWALVYTGCQSLVLARMMLAQAAVLAESCSPNPSGPAAGSTSLVRNGCFVVDAMLAFATGAQQTLVDEDAISFDLGEVGEWDPWVNALSHESSAVPLGATAQAPPSRTGSIYIEMIKLMTVLRHATQKDANPDGSALELETWKNSLAPSLQAPVIQQLAAQQKPLPSQLNLRLWFVAVSHTIASLQRGPAPSMTARDVQNEPSSEAAKALEATVRYHDYRLLPSSASVLVRQILAPTPAVSKGQDQLAANFADHWAWSATSPISNARVMIQGSTMARRVNNGPQVGTPPASAASSIAMASGSDHLCRSATRHHTAIRGAGTEKSLATALQARRQQMDLPRNFGPHPSDGHPASSTENETSSAHVPGPENPFSHDLLDYLTMFEGDQSYNTNFMEPLGFFPR